MSATYATAGSGGPRGPQAPQPLTLKLASALFEIEATDPGHTSRRVLKVVCVLVAILVVWACIAKLDIVAVAQGRLVPQTYVKIVQPAEAGIIREILVEEGDTVQAGQVLVRLDPTVNAADSAATTRELALQRLQLRRVEAELTGIGMKRESSDDALLFAQVEAQRVTHRQAFWTRLPRRRRRETARSKELDAAREVLQKLETTLPSYERSAEAYEKLASQQLVGTLQAEEHRREAQEKAQDLEAQRATVASLGATIVQQDEKLAQLRSTYRSDLNQARLETITAINRLKQQKEKLRFQESLLELRAPQAGVVKELATTTIGAVVQPGTVLLSLVPQSEPLLAEVSIENQDIGFVREGQPVRLKLAAYPFQKYGMLEGIVKTVSADSSTREPPTQAGASGRGQTGEAPTAGLAFKALVELRVQKLAVSDLTLPLAAGMQVSAEIIEGERTVLEYLLSPVQRVANEAARER
jgi:HlyD family secretion protein